MDDKKKRQEEAVETDKERVAEDVQVEEKETEALLQKIQETEDKYRRALADYQNLQRRTIDEKREWAKLSNKDLVLKLLPILDTLMLAEKHTKDQNFVLTVGQFLQVLRDEGIERIKTVGETFDPLIMEVVDTREGEEHKVLEEVKAGFKSGDVILRPALVVVGKGK